GATYGQGANEVPVRQAWWINTNLTGAESKLWHVRRVTSTDNRWAEFSSFYSEPTEDDEAWLITPSIILGDSNYFLSFDYQIRFYNYDNLTVYISRDFDSLAISAEEDEENSSTVEDIIEAATWEPINANFPSGQTN